MKTYIGTKIIEARPMTRGEYNLFRGWTIPAGENPVDAGYLVRYPDGYVSWSPALQFEEAYRESSGINFGLAVEAMRRGKRVARSGWNGKGMWLAYSPGNAVEPGKLWSPAAAAWSAARGVATEVLPYIIMKTADDKIVPWLASQTDILAEDWAVLE